MGWWGARACSHINAMLQVWAARRNWREAPLRGLYRLRGSCGGSNAFAPHRIVSVLGTTSAPPELHLGASTWPLALPNNSPPVGRRLSQPALQVHRCGHRESHERGPLCKTSGGASEERAIRGATFRRNKTETAKQRGKTAELKRRRVGGGGLQREVGGGRFQDVTATSVDGEPASSEPSTSVPAASDSVLALSTG